MDYIQSTSSNEGTAQIEVIFLPGVDPDVAAMNVQNRVSQASSSLPQEVLRVGVETRKQQTSALLFISAYSTVPEYDLVFIQNYMDIHIIPLLKRINGVGDVTSFSNRKYAMRIWLDPLKLASYNLIPQDIIQALNQQSLEVAAGQLGQNIGESFQYTIRYEGRYNQEYEYENIVIKGLSTGEILRLKDVATVAFDSENYSIYAEVDNYQGFPFGVFQTPGTNAQDIIVDIRATLEAARQNLPEGLAFKINLDTTEFTSAALRKVFTTIIEAFILVFLVVFVFLQNFRATLIPLLAVPVSIIGTLFFLFIFGYSINILTLFALVLAIGIVVDDAIVVVEAVHAKMHETGSSAKEAAYLAMSEIYAAIISITLVMAAVFIPVTFIAGTIGVFYQQFGVTMMIAIIISAINALTLSPALCALFLKPELPNPRFKKFNTGFESLNKNYRKGLIYLLKYRWIGLLTLLGSFLLIIIINKKMPSGFVPVEDRGFVFGSLELAPGSSLDRVFHVQKIFQEQALQIPGVEFILLTAGRNVTVGAGTNYGMFFIRLEPYAIRNSAEKQVENIIAALFKLSQIVPDAKMIFFQPPSVPGFGRSSGFEFSLLDRLGGDIRGFSEVADRYIQELSARPEIAYAQTVLNVDYPQWEVQVNINRAIQSGIQVADIFNVLQGYIGGIYSADFNRYGKLYRVMVQALPEHRINLHSLDNLFVRSSSGEMAAITEFIELKRVYGPQFINRFNLYTSANITGAPAAGYSMGEAILAIQEVAANLLSSDYAIDYTGLTREQVKASTQTTVIFLICILFIYLLLSAQYESFILPLVILISLPLGIMGAFLGQYLLGLENNIYFQIALIMLVGLLAKNAILIVEFALQARQSGMSITAAALAGAVARLRPILMTSFAFILGLLPLVFSSGVGAVGNRSIGSGAAIGLFIGTVLSVLIVPLLFVLFQGLQEKIKPLKH